MKSEENKGVAARLWLDAQGKTAFQFAPRSKPDLFNHMGFVINALQAEIEICPDGARKDCQVGLRDILAEALHQLREEQAFWECTLVQ